MANEIYDDLDELPAAPRIDISEVDLALLERAARAIGAVRVEVVDGEGYVNLHFADGPVCTAGTRSCSAAMHSTWPCGFDLRFTYMSTTPRR